MGDEFEVTVTQVENGPVDIARDPDLGKRVSALQHAREAVASRSRPTILSGSTDAIVGEVDGLLDVADWLLDETGATAWTRMDTEQRGYRRQAMTDAKVKRHEAITERLRHEEI